MRARAASFSAFACAIGSSSLRAQLPGVVARAVVSRSVVRPLSGGPSKPERVFTGYRFRKPEGLIEITARPAKFKAVGSTGIYHNLSKEGAVRISVYGLAPPGQGAPGGAGPSSEPTYDYNNKIYVDVSALDIVSIVQSPITQPVSGVGSGREFQ